MIQLWLPAYKQHFQYRLLNWIYLKLKIHATYQQTNKHYKSLKEATICALRKHKNQSYYCKSCVYQTSRVSWLNTKKNNQNVRTVYIGITFYSIYTPAIQQHTHTDTHNKKKNMTVSRLIIIIINMCATTTMIMHMFVVVWWLLRLNQVHTYSNMLMLLATTIIKKNKKKIAWGFRISLAFKKYYTIRVQTVRFHWPYYVMRAQK